VEPIAVYMDVVEQLIISDPTPVHRISWKDVFIAELVLSTLIN